VESLKEFKGILWGKIIVVYTDHKNLMQEALGLTSNRKYRWRLIIKECNPEIIRVPSRLNLEPSPGNDIVVS
jgi:hypothetical protein